MTHPRRTFLASLAAGIACLAAAPVLAAAPAPLPKNITLVVPFGPGASNDAFARVIAQKLGPRIGANVIVDNKPGAGSVIGSSFVARAPADGSVLMLTSSTFTTSAAVQKNLPYDPIKGFAPVSLVATGPMLLTVGAQTPYKTAADLIADARANKGRINYASAGIGSRPINPSRDAAHRNRTSMTRPKDRRRPRASVAPSAEVQPTFPLESLLALS